MVVATFLDFGTVTPERLPFHNTHRMLYAVGFGLRYLTPVGPSSGLRIPAAVGPTTAAVQPTGPEIKYTVNDAFLLGMEPGVETGSGVNDSCFGIGGWRRETWVNDSLCAFHTSIGEAF